MSRKQIIKIIQMRRASHWHSDKPTRADTVTYSNRNVSARLEDGFKLLRSNERA